MNVGSRIKQRRKELGYSADFLAERIGVSRSTIFRYENGDIDKLPVDVLTPLATVLQTTPAYLMGWEEEVAASNIPTAKSIMPIGKGSRIPLYGRIACGAPILAVEDLEETAWLPEGIKADFALTCCGDSMINARIFDGDIVFIRAANSVNNGEIAAVIVRDEEVTLKRLYYHPDEGRLVLRAENPMVRLQEYVGDELNHIRVLGKAIAFMSIVR